MLQFTYLAELPLLTIKLPMLRTHSERELREEHERQLQVVADMLELAGFPRPTTPLQWRCAARALGVSVDNRVPRLVEIEEAAAELLRQQEGETQQKFQRRLDGQRPGGRRVRRDEAEIAVTDWLKVNATADPWAIRRDEVARRLGVSGAMVSRTRAWREFQRRRRELKAATPRTVPLSDEMLVVVHKECQRPDELAELIEEQRRELEAEARQR